MLVTQGNKHEKKNRNMMELRSKIVNTTQTIKEMKSGFIVSNCNDSNDMVPCYIKKGAVKTAQ